MFELGFGLGFGFGFGFGSGFRLGIKGRLTVEAQNVAQVLVWARVMVVDVVAVMASTPGIHNHSMPMT